MDESSLEADERRFLSWKYFIRKSQCRLENPHGQAGFGARMNQLGQLQDRRLTERDVL